MNEDYLWDKSGESDPEIERLENTLGRLRYRRPAEPLPLPATSRWAFRFSFPHPALAIAAALLLLLLAGGLWLGLQRRSGQTEAKNTLANSNAPVEKQSEPVASGVRPPLGTGNPVDNKLTADGNKPGVIQPAPIAPHNKLPRRFSGRRQLTARHRDVKAVTRREELAREGEQAKAQLIMALHIASDKLNAVQKKIHTNPGT
jgi:hypothetical protein